MERSKITDKNPEKILSDKETEKVLKDLEYKEELPDNKVPEHYHKVDKIKYRDLWDRPKWKKLTGITINNTETTIAHGLGIAPNMWFAECTTGNADVVLKTKDFDATNIYLKIAQVIVQVSITVNIFVKYDPDLIT